jgi:hypothetical protein
LIKTTRTNNAKKLLVLLKEWEEQDRVAIQNIKPYILVQNKPAE